jgi:TPR repeat protein
LEEYAKAVRKATGEKDVAAVVVEYLWMVPVLDVVPPGIPRVVDTHDLMYVTKDMYGPLYHWIDISREDEAAILSAADIVIAIQRDEAAEFRDMLPEYTDVVELGHPVETDDCGCDSTADIVIVIGSDNPSNIHGMTKFLEHWPKVMETRPEAELRVYGNLAGAIGDCGGMVRYGFYHDLRRAYAVAKVVINPSELGTGLKIKTVEAMAKGKAVVTLENGASGIDEGIAVCEGYEAMADEIVRLLEDNDKRRQLEREAIKYIGERYSHKAVFSQFMDAMTRWRSGTHYHCLGDQILKTYPERAVRAWRAGAALGSTQSMKNLAWVYRDGHMVAQDMVEVEKWESKLEENKRSRSDPDIGQDLWVLDVLGEMRDGFFVEAGASGGVQSSNTCLLERSYGWSGICVEPSSRFFGELVKSRECQCVSVCLAGECGEVDFIEAEYYGGIREHLQEHHRDGWEDGKTVKKRALSLQKLLEECNAPKTIDYLSLDLEGSELEVLRVFPFDQYKIRCMTIELSHRDEIIELVKSKGFVVVSNPYQRPHVDWELHCVSADLYEKVSDNGMDYHFEGDSLLYDENDPDGAFARWLKGAETGSIQCMRNLAWAYREGVGTDKDEWASKEWSERVENAEQRDGKKTSLGLDREKKRQEFLRKERKVYLSSVEVGHGDIVLLTQYYTNKDCPMREAENDLALKRNLANPSIKKVVLFMEEDVDIPFRSDKVERVFVNDRMTYKDGFDYMRGKPGVKLMANSDIYFEPSIAELTKAELENRLLSMSRHDLEPDGRIVDPRPCRSMGCEEKQEVKESHSSDAWVWRDLRQFENNIYLGVYCCETLMLGNAMREGIEVINVGRLYNAIHIHWSSLRPQTNEEGTSFYVRDDFKGTAVAENKNEIGL